jgi:hypothetical protein
LVTVDDEVDLAVGLMECTVGVAPFGRWWWNSFLSIVFLAIVVVLATSVVMWIISLIVTLVAMAILTTVTPVVFSLVIVDNATVVVTPVIAAVVTAIITSIPIIIARIGPAIPVISSIRSTVTVIVALDTALVVVVVAPSPLGGRRDCKGALQLLTLPHGVFGIAVKLALVVHDHVEVTFEEGGRSWWIRHIGFAGSLS